MAMRINNAILHVINNSGGQSYLSTQELDIGSEVCEEFVTKHIKKLMNNTSVKEATFNADSKMYGVISSFINGKIFFSDAAEQICSHLSEIMLKNENIPSADLLIVQYTNKNADYLAIIKLNYKECFTHQVKNAENGADNQIVKYHAVLPFDSGKVEEACVIPYEPMIIRLIEKAYMVNNELTNYFSELFLDCGSEMSKKDAARIINEVTDEINGRYFNGVETSAKVKSALLTSCEDGVVSVESVAAEVFSDNEEVKNEYINMVREAGIKTDINFGERFVRQQFGNQRMKADNGVEIKFPVELIDDKDYIEFINNPDGTISVIIKNLRMAE